MGWERSWFLAAQSGETPQNISSCFGKIRAVDFEDSIHEGSKACVNLDIESLDPHTRSLRFTRFQGHIQEIVVGSGPQTPHSGDGSRIQDENVALECLE